MESFYYYYKRLKLYNLNATKNSSIALILFSTVSVSSCKKITTNHLLKIDLQSDFENDSEELFIDGEQKINGLANTTNLVGVCELGWQDSLVANGKHQLKAIINNSAIKTETFYLKCDLFIGVTYHQNLIRF